MTIASAFNEITANLGGTPSTSGTIAGAIDALNDTLAGSDQDAAQTIEGAIRLLGENVGGGDGDASTATITYTLTGGKSDLYVDAAVAAEDESGKCSYPFFQSNETSGSFTVLLFGGKASALFGESLVTVVSGDAEADGDTLTVTGDCTVAVDPD
ncbi:MAG: hypothetical protein IKE20_04320 [Eggerthellaceae bacterium]|nr:hypothetical protein [Eggerthellaceae bacterium]